jgi:endoglucanase
MDEVGLMMVHEDEDGFFQFETVGGIDPRYLPGKQVVVGRDHVIGVIGTKPIHLMDSEERQNTIEVSSMRIDLGLEGKAKVGDRATFATKFRRVGTSIMSKAIDDRIGVATLIELLKHASKHIDLCLSFSVQEEIGLRGAKVAGHYFEPDLAIAVDSTPARDLPDFEGRENFTYNTKLGLGPAIYMANSSTLDDPRLVRFLAETAEREKIPYQFRQPGGGGTNAGAIQQSRAGVPVVSLSVPHRYTHSPVSVARVDDWKNTLNLLHVALNRMTRELLATR